MFCDIISSMKHRCPESDSEILGDFIFLTIVHTEETEQREIKVSINCFTYTHACVVWHIERVTDFNKCSAQQSFIYAAHQHTTPNVALLA